MPPAPEDKDLVLVLHLSVPGDEPPIETILAVESALHAVTKTTLQNRIWAISHDAHAILREALTHVPEAHK